MSKKIDPFKLIASTANQLTGGITGSITGITGVGDGPKGLPSGGPKPIPELTAEEIAKQRAGVTGADQAPAFLGLSPLMTNLQQRTAIATGATNSNNPGVYTDPEALKYYRNLALQGVNNWSDVTPVEQQYLKSLGQEAKSQTTEGYFSALSRAIGG